MTVGVPAAIFAAMLVIGATVVAIVKRPLAIAACIGQLCPLFERESPPSDDLLDAQAEARTAETTSKKVANREFDLLLPDTLKSYPHLSEDRLIVRNT